MTHSSEEALSDLHDGEILAQFLERKSEDSFAELVRRHGGMVLGVCRSVLGGAGGGAADAEDAAQAVFLTLAQRAKSLRNRKTLAGWLHKVAWFVAMRARQAAAIRRRHEQQAARMGNNAGATMNTGDLEIPPEQLYAALERLPEKYRLALLLHHVEGRTEAETAALLGCSLSAASVRLSRGREMLRARLSMGGMNVSAAGAMAVLGAGGKGAAAISPAWIAGVSHAATALAAGQVVGTTASSVALSKGAMKMLFWMQAKVAAMVAICGVVLVGGAATTYVAVAQAGRGGSEAPATTPVAPAYRLTKLGTFGGKNSFAAAINSLGEVVGGAEIDPTTPEGKVAPGEQAITHAYLYSGGKMRDLGTLGGRSSAARNINMAGQIVGFAQVDPATPEGQAGPDNRPIEHAFLYENGKMRDLGTLGGKFSRADGINSTGQIVGQADLDPLQVTDTRNKSHAFLYSGGKMRDLGGDTSVALRINDAGVIVGTSFFNVGSGNSLMHAATFDGEKAQFLDLPSLQGSYADWINTTGQITGSFTTNTRTRRAETIWRAFIYSSGQRRDLGTLGGESTRANAINDLGQVVGMADIAQGGTHGFLYKDGRIQDLNDLVGAKALEQVGFTALIDAFAINQQGQIVGKGTDADGNEVAFLLTPLADKEPLATTAAKLPFTISKETTAIISPLNSDGTPDYIAAFNERYGNEITLDNNGFALWLQIVGNPPADADYLTRVPRRDEHLSRELFAKIVELAGVPPASRRPDWIYYSDFLEKEKGYSAKAARDKYNEMTGLNSVLWTADQQPEVAEYLNRVGPFLDQTIAAAARPQWFEPEVSTDQRTTNILPASTLYQEREACRMLCARAMLRAGSGEFDGFLADVIGAERLGLHLAATQWRFTAVTGISMVAVADTAIEAELLSGKLTSAQCQELSKALAGLPAMENPVKSLGAQERWGMLDGSLHVPLGRIEEFRQELLAMAGTEGPTNVQWLKGVEQMVATLRSIDRNQVDWDIVLKRLNQLQDERVAALALEPLAAMKSRCDSIDEKITGWGSAIAPEPTLLNKKQGESREQYSERVAQGMTAAATLQGSTNADIASVDAVIEERVRVHMMQHEMLAALAAAATVRAKTGAWPATVGELVPRVLKKLPMDIYSESGKAAVKYKLTEKGPCIYSVGPNGVDDGGRTDAAAQADDIAVGPG